MNELLKIYDKLLQHYGTQAWWQSETKDEVIIGAILTQNTNWKNVVKAIDNLKEYSLCSLAAIEDVETEKLALLIKPSGYYNVKATRLQHVSRALNDVDLDEMPLKEAREYLLNIKGVGNETADSILLYAYRKPAFVIDAYTIRLIDRLYPENKMKKYDEYKAYFEQQLPQEVLLFDEFHALIVRHGKIYCRKRALCDGCPLIDICSSFQRG